MQLDAQKAAVIYEKEPMKKDEFKVKVKGVWQQIPGSSDAGCTTTTESVQNI